MKFYHGTTEDIWKEIQEEGVLFGKRPGTTQRATYLTTDKEEAEYYGDVILEVEYDPFEHSDMNNFCTDCWQFRVYEPIDLDNVTELKSAKKEYQKMYGFPMPDIKERKYIITSRKFDHISSAAVPCSGQIATNSKILAKLIYKLWRRWSYKYYGSIAVMLLERNKYGKYDAIER